MHGGGEGPGKTPSTLRSLSYPINSFLTDIKCLAKDQQGGTLSAPFWCLRQTLSLSLLYFNETLLHKNSERSSLVIGPGLNSSPPEAKNPSAFHSSATAFHLGGSSGILQDKVRTLGALVLCSPTKHFSCCTLLTLCWASVCDQLKETHVQTKGYVVICGSKVTSCRLWQKPCQAIIPTC